MTLHQGRYVTVPGAANQIALPMTGNGAVLDFCGPFPDGDGINDLTARLSSNSRVHLLDELVEVIADIRKKYADKIRARKGEL
jgi:hypothetical protein